MEFLPCVHYDIFYIDGKAFKLRFLMYRTDTGSEYRAFFADGYDIIDPKEYIVLNPSQMIHYKDHPEVYYDQIKDLSNRTFK